MHSEQYIIWFDQLCMTDVARVGGKNASLGEMISQLSMAGVNVPTGFATTASAYRDFLAQYDLLLQPRIWLMPHLPGNRKPYSISAD